jgi:hypothetical protein
MSSRGTGPMRLRLSVLLRSVSSLVLNGNGHELTGTRLALELVMRWPRRTLEVARYALAILSYLVVMVRVMGVVLGVELLPE